MKYLAIGLALLGVCVSGQVLFPHRHPPKEVASTVSTPPNIDVPFIRYWWIADDVTNSPVVTNWVDRIQSRRFGNGVSTNTSPLGTVSGVQFTGSQWLTNSDGYPPITSVGAGTNVGTLMVIITPQTPSTSFGGVLVTWPLADDTGMYTKPNGTIVDNGDFTVIADYVTGKTLDIIQVTTNSNSSVFYTNGVQSLSGTYNATPAGGGAVIGVNSRGLQTLSANEWYKGYINEIVYYSNYMTASDINLLHKYATNKYGYTP